MSSASPMAERPSARLHPPPPPLTPPLLPSLLLPVEPARQPGPTPARADGSVGGG